MNIINIVATVSLSSPLDLDEVQRALPGSQRCRGGARWLKYRLGTKKRYVAFYSSGKFLITGVRTESDILDISAQVVEQLHTKGIDVIVKEITVQNIVARDKIVLDRGLENIIHSLDPTKAGYEPEQFVGLIYKDWGVGFVLFSSGEIIIAGIKKGMDIESLVSRFRAVVSNV